VLVSDPTYELVAGALRPDGTFDVSPHSVIRKRRLELRRVNHIKRNSGDVDEVVFMERPTIH